MIRERDTGTQRESVGLSLRGSVTVQFIKRKRHGPKRKGGGRVIAFRVFAALCAGALVCAFAIAALLPPEMDLGTMLVTMDPPVLASIHGFFVGHGAPGIYSHLLLPFLLRPGWMLPAMFGVIAGGIAFSVNHNGHNRQSTRRSG
ncbi:hypothetical protein [Lichenicoccus sp.]|uniref:hypothetical protein n=1 Tax=Lichenicoccus sp. TaxID=2781899 RepID=UPI003D14FB61